MLHAPEKYLNLILTKFGIDRDITLLIHHFIINANNSIHFIIDEKELDLSTFLFKECQYLKSSIEFNFQVGQRVVKIKNPNSNFTKSAVQCNLSPMVIKSLEPTIILSNSDNYSKNIKNLDKFIPITNYNIERVGIIQNRIEAFEKKFYASEQSDFFNNEKLLVIGNRNLFQTIPKDLPACYVSENENGSIEIEYNSPILPKITILKNLKLIDNYQQQEINGTQVNFKTCIFIGSSKFENCINIIRNYYNQGLIKKFVFIGEKDIKIDLGNNQIPLRWKWTIPELNFFKGQKTIQHKHIVIENCELDIAISEFYQKVIEIERRHTICLNSIYYFIRKLYYDWSLKQETAIFKLQQIQLEFDIALKQLLIETLGNIFPDFNFDEYLIPLSEKYNEIIRAIMKNNKSEKLKFYQKQIHQLIIPSFLRNVFKAELNELIRNSQFHGTVDSFQEYIKLHNEENEQLNKLVRPYYSLNSNELKTEIVSLSKSNDLNNRQNKLITSIYGNGKVVKLIEKLGRASSEYMILLYSIEEKAFKFYIDKYHESLNKEYNSTNRFSISGVVFDENYYQYSTYDEWLEDFFNYKTVTKETENYKITFTDRSKVKLPTNKRVLKVQNNEKHLVLVDDLNTGDKVRIYENPDKEMLRTIFELKNPELKAKADEYSLLWKRCLNDAYQKNILEVPLYKQLVNNHFSVSEQTFKRYLEGDVMFPRSFSDLIIIAKTINDPRLSFDFLKNTMKPKIEEYRGKEIEYGFKLSNSINQFIISNEADEFISEWLTKSQIENIVSQLPVRIVKEIELMTQNSDD